MKLMRSNKLATVAVLLALTLLISGCSSTEDKATVKIETVANFYPVQWLLSEIGGDDVNVTSLTPDGVEPHDLTLDPQAVASLTDAQITFYIGAGFQPDVEAAIANLKDSSKAIDLLKSPGLLILNAPNDIGKETLVEGKDPHVWLDPTNMMAMAKQISTSLSKAAPDSVSVFKTNLESVLERLGSLDSDMKSQLSSCKVKALVTSHAAFGYLSSRYGFEQIAIGGISPNDEPDAKLLSLIAKVSKAKKIATVYFEEVLPKALVERVAKEIGADTSLLSALEFTPEDSGDYISVMRSNLANLVAGQNC